MPEVLPRAEGNDQTVSDNVSNTHHHHQQQQPPIATANTRTRTKTTAITVATTTRTVATRGIGWYFRCFSGTLSGRVGHTECGEDSMGYWLVCLVRNETIGEKTRKFTSIDQATPSIILTPRFPRATKNKTRAVEVQ